MLGLVYPKVRVRNPKSTTASFVAKISWYPIYFKLAVFKGSWVMLTVTVVFVNSETYF